jgi:hypothetical protein
MRSTSSLQQLQQQQQLNNSSSSSSTLHAQHHSEGVKEGGSVPLQLHPVDHCNEVRVVLLLVAQQAL